MCVCVQNLKSVGLQPETSVTGVSAVSTCCLHVAYMRQVAVTVSVLIVAGVSMLSILIACAQSVHMLLMLLVCCGCWYAVSADSVCVACVSVPSVLIVLYVSVCHQC